jgi:hypothetical protein
VLVKEIPLIWLVQEDWHRRLARLSKKNIALAYSEAN